MSDDCLTVGKAAARMAAVPSKLGARVTALRRLCVDLRQRLRAGQAVQADLAEVLGSASPACLQRQRSK